MEVSPQPRCSLIGSNVKTHRTLRVRVLSDSCRVDTLSFLPSKLSFRFQERFPHFPRVASRARPGAASLRSHPPRAPPLRFPPLVRIGADAVGWCIDVLDIPGVLTQYLLPEPPPNDAGADWTPSPADARMWHRVTVVGRPGDSSGSSGSNSIGRNSTCSQDDAREERREGKQQQQQAEACGGDTKGGVAAAEPTTIEAGESSSSVFVVEFENGRTATLDLSQMDLKWVQFCGVDTSGGRGVRSAQEQQQQQAKAPPGFGARSENDGGDGSGGGLAYDDTDVGTRVDVWWPRYNSYFRATVSVVRGRAKAGAGYSLVWGERVLSVGSSRSTAGARAL